MTVTTQVGEAELEAARLLLERIGVTPEQLLQAATPRPPARQLRTLSGPIY